MKLSVVTPTGDRQPCINRLAQMLKRMTVQPDEWVIGDDGEVPTIADAVVVRGEYPGIKDLSCLKNFERALRACTGDIIVLTEDDDWYAPDHLAVMVEWLEKYPVVASGRMRIYALNRQAWRDHGDGPVGDASPQGYIGMRRDFLPKALKMMRGDQPMGWSKRLWRKTDRAPLAVMPMTVVSMRGFVSNEHGVRGHITTKHLNDRGWTFDADFCKLREWLGAEAEQYIPMVNTCNP